jgi:hypothetical protein
METSEEILVLFLDGHNVAVENEELRIVPHLEMPQLTLKNGTPIAVRTLGNPNKLPPLIERIRFRQEFFLYEMAQEILAYKVFFQVSELHGFAEFFHYQREGYDVSSTSATSFWRRWRYAPAIEQRSSLISPDRNGYWAVVEDIAYENGNCFFTATPEREVKSRVYQIDAADSLIWATRTPELIVPKKFISFDESSFRDRTATVPIPAKRDDLKPSFQPELQPSIVQALQLDVMALRQELLDLKSYTSSLHSYVVELSDRVNSQNVITDADPLHLETATPVVFEVQSELTSFIEGIESLPNSDDLTNFV